MDCKSCREQLLAYARGRLGADERDAFEKHLAMCPECRLETGREQHLNRLLHDWVPPEPTPDFNARLEERLATERRRPRGGAWTAWRWPALGLAAGAAAALAIWAGPLHRSVSPAIAPPAAEENTVRSETEIMENVDLLDDLDLLEHWDELQDMKNSDQRSRLPETLDVLGEG